ncbi:cytochrome P450 [Alteraurantiacibacter aestuarii]|uniref:Cytochrome P450 n=1 Tax=Alteraurantiacibacter aestuarii TaxID=650004 RepID=A0A844ZRD8_9SPHN|nr:cytochrome P450 [Alteraurantiacibacter aestuarii]MXO88169.1 cytochrome P450 [Alteraurantiacibacter aestuarii]
MGLFEASVPHLTVDPFDEEFLADPFAHHGRLRDAGPVVWLEKYQVYAMARFEEVQAALRDHETFCSARGVGLADFAKEEPFRAPSLLLETDPPLHSQTRKLMSRIVSLKALKELRPLWQEKAQALVASLVERGRFDAATDLGEVFPMQVFPDTIGLMDEGREKLIEYATIVFNGFGPRNRVFEQSLIGKEDSIAWVEEACKRENLKPGGWGMAVYDAVTEAGLPPDYAPRLVRSFLSAGVDTTVNGISHLMLALGKYPQEFSKLCADPKLATRAFEESLRWDSTVQTFFRTATRDVDVAGTTIPEGAKVLLFLASANRDPRKWDGPDEFRIERPAGGHVGFGFGIHQCLGQMVARLEGELIAAEFARQASSIRIAGEPVRRLNNTLWAISSLPVEVAGK